MPVPVAARSKAWVCGCSPAEVVGLHPTGGMGVCCECRVLSGRGLCYERIILCVWSINLVNEEAMDHWGLLRQIKTNVCRMKRLCLNLEYCCRIYVDGLRITTKKSGYPLTSPTFEPETSRVWIRSGNHSTAMFGTMYIKLATFSRGGWRGGKTNNVRWCWRNMDVRENVLL